MLLTELHEDLAEACGVISSTTTIACTLHRRGVTLKQLGELLDGHEFLVILPVVRLSYNLARIPHMLLWVFCMYFRSFGVEHWWSAHMCFFSAAAYRYEFSCKVIEEGT